MKVFLSGNLIASEILTVNDGLNYGRFFNADIEKYEVRLTQKEFVNLIEREYNQVRDEIRVDDATYHDTSDFSASNYCTLEELFSFSIEFELIFKNYLDRIIFSKLFPVSSENRFVINSTEKVAIIEGDIVITGGAYHVKSHS
ncbi:hypothetical protein V6R21_03665 [Limibacter armeniacum]|uniref:hypothetical protein n=1 Tax=Limibacter armeniacum TaxID=466084 RepID=UPI002FE5C398